MPITLGVSQHPVTGTAFDFRSNGGFAFQSSVLLSLTIGLASSQVAEVLAGSAATTVY
jgi:hypothetical protein